MPWRFAESSPGTRYPHCRGNDERSKRGVYSGGAPLGEGGVGVAKGVMVVRGGGLGGEGEGKEQRVGGWAGVNTFIVTHLLPFWLCV